MEITLLTNDFDERERDGSVEREVRCPLQAIVASGPTRAVVSSEPTRAVVTAGALEAVVLEK